MNPRRVYVTLELWSEDSVAALGSRGNWEAAWDDFCERTATPLKTQVLQAYACNSREVDE